MLCLCRTPGQDGLAVRLLLVHCDSAVGAVASACSKSRRYSWRAAEAARPGGGASIVPARPRPGGQLPGQGTNQRATGSGPAEPPAQAAKLERLRHWAARSARRPRRRLTIRHTGEGVEREGGCSPRATQPNWSSGVPPRTTAPVRSSRRVDRDTVRRLYPT